MLPEEAQINDDKRDNDRDETETEHVADVVPSDALACLRGRNDSFRRLSISFFIFRCSGIRAHFASQFIPVLAKWKRAV
jgi:hypothetical protein